MQAEIKSYCPYCNQILSQRPTRKKKCPNCGYAIFVRGGQLMTEEQATVNDWLKRLSSLGLSEAVYQYHKDALSKQYGFTPPIEDIIWRFLNSCLINPSNYFTNKCIYFEMARLVAMEGKDPKPYQIEAAKQELLELKASGIKIVTIYTCNDSFVCSECKKLSQVTMTIEEALRTMPIPNVCTSDNGCRCWYGYPSWLTIIEH